MTARIVQNRYFRVTLPAAIDDVPTERIEAVVADAAESFMQTLGLADGTRSGQIVLWRGLFERAVMSACLDSEAAA